MIIGNARIIQRIYALEDLLVESDELVILSAKTLSAVDVERLAACVDDIANLEPPECGFLLGADLPPAGYWRFLKHWQHMTSKAASRNLRPLMKYVRKLMELLMFTRRMTTAKKRKSDSRCSTDLLVLSAKPPM